MATTKTHDYRVGDTVWYTPFLATMPREVIVTSKHADIKHGAPGFDGYCPAEDTTVWGYDGQITRVRREDGDGSDETHDGG